MSFPEAQDAMKVDPPSSSCTPADSGDLKVTCNEEDDDDIDWEEGSDGEQGFDDGGRGEEEEDEDEGEEEDGYGMEEDLKGLEDLEIDLKEDSAAGVEVSKANDVKGSKRRKRTGRTQDEKLRDYHIHCAHLVCLHMRARLMSQHTQDPTLMAIAVSTVPSPLLTTFEALSPGAPAKLQDVRRLSRWFHETYECIADEDVTESEGREGSGVERLCRVVSQQAGSGHELLQVFVATCRALGLQTRYVCPLDAVSYHEPPYMKARKKGPGAVVDLTRDSNIAVSGLTGAFVWAEVYCTGGSSASTDDLATTSKGKGRRKQYLVELQAERGGRRRGRGGKGSSDTANGRKRSREGGDAKATNGAEAAPAPASASSSSARVAATAAAASARPAAISSFPSSSSSSASAAAAAPPSAPLPRTRSLPSSSSAAGGAASRGAGNVIEVMDDDDDQPSAVALPSKKSASGPSTTTITTTTSGGRWVCINVLRGPTLDRPSAMEAHKPHRKPLLYIVAIDDAHRATDVTRRYVTQFSRVAKLRARFWKDHIKKVNARIDAEFEARKLVEGDFRSLFGRRARAEKEEEELKEKAKSEPMPTSLEAFKRHPVYCLERHLGRFQVLWPQKVVGMFKGEAVYRREHVKEACTAKQWKERYARMVKAGEEPCRVVVPNAKTTKAGGKGNGKGKGKGKGKKGGDGEEDGDEMEVDDAKEGAGAGAGAGGGGGGEEDGGAVMEGGGGKATKKQPMRLFGEWQTEPYKAPALLAGDLLPLNDHGNIEVLNYNKAFLPQGTCHIKKCPGMFKVARQLGIQTVPALVGWETKQGRSVPVMDGVVCLARHKDTLVDAYQGWAHAKEEKAVQAKESRVAKQWARLVTGMFKLQELKEKYGEDGGGTGKDKKGGKAGGVSSGGAAAVAAVKRAAK